MSEEIISDDDLLGLVKEDIKPQPKAEVTKPEHKVEQAAPKESPKPTISLGDLTLGELKETTKQEVPINKAEVGVLDIEIPEVGTAPITVPTEVLKTEPILAAVPVVTDIFAPEAEKFDLSPAKISESIAVVIVGDKGSGKTTLVFNPKFFPGKIAAITMDEMTQHIWREIYKSDPRITIYDGLRYYNPTTADEIVDSASKSLQYLSLLLIKEIETKDYDWILWDCSEELQEVCEMAMRKDAGFKAKDGVPWQYWRLRNMHMDNIFNKSLKVTKRGVIFTLYTGYRDIKESGEVMNTLKEIKWAGNLKTQSLVIIETSKRVTSEGKRYYMNVESSKVPSLFRETPAPMDVTIKF